MRTGFNKLNCEKRAVFAWDRFICILNRSKEFYDKNKPMFDIKEGGKERFINNFCTRYEFVMESYMIDKVTNLDRHKVATIVIIELIRSDVLEYTNYVDTNDDAIFILIHLLATQTGLAFMQYRLNILLENRNYAPIKEWHLPTPLTCPNNSYDYIFARNLYYTEARLKHENPTFAINFNEMDLAEKLYLFEYVNLLYYGINPLDLISKK